MRLLLLAVLASSGVASASPDPAVSDRPTDLLPSVALRGGFHHTQVHKDDGEPSGVGGKLELEVFVRPLPYVIVGAVAGYTHYQADRLRDRVTGSTYSARFDNPWLGGRVYARPHWRAFVGLGLFSMWEHEQTNGVRTDSRFHRETVVDALVGVNLAWTHRFLVQLAATGTRYSQYRDLEHVTSFGLVCGLAY